MNTRLVILSVILFLHFISLSQSNTYDFSQHAYIEGKVINGKPEGVWKYTFDELKCDLFFVNGLKIGIQTSYYASGEVMSIKNFNSQGFLDGKQFILFKNGDTAFKENYKNGIPHGKWNSYHRSKNQKSKAFYANGKIIHFSEYKDNQLEPFQSINNGSGNIYIVDGQDSTTYSYHSGLIHGERIRDNNGTEVSFDLYKNGIKIDGIENDTFDNSVEVFTVEPRVSLSNWMKKVDFYGGYEGVQNHIGVNIRYPEEALENDADGIVTCEFTVDTKGNVINCSSLGDKIGYGLEEEGIRVIKSTSYLWTPASQDGFPVEMRMRIPVKFKIY